MGAACSIHVKDMHCNQTTGRKETTWETWA